MTIDIQSIPMVGDGEILGIVGGDTGRVHDSISKDRLDRMDPWQFAESIALRDKMLGASGVTETCNLVALPEPAVAQVVSE